MNDKRNITTGFFIVYFLKVHKNMLISIIKFEIFKKEHNKTRGHKSRKYY